MGEENFTLGSVWIKHNGFSEPSIIMYEGRSEDHNTINYIYYEDYITEGILPNTYRMPIAKFSEYRLMERDELVKYHLKRA